MKTTTDNLRAVGYRAIVRLQRFLRRLFVKRKAFIRQRPSGDGWIAWGAFVPLRGNGPLEEMGNEDVFFQIGDSENGVLSALIDELAQQYRVRDWFIEKRQSFFSQASQ